MPEAVYLGPMDRTERAQSMPVTVRDADGRDVLRFREGDESAFEALVLRHERQLYQIALRMLGSREDAMEAVQETFLRIFRSLKDFRGDAAFRTWAVGILLNLCRSRIVSTRERMRRREMALVKVDDEGEMSAVDPPDQRPDPEAAALGGELRQALEHALGRVSPEHREILILREIQGMEYEELGQALGCAHGTVKSRLCRARQALREALEGVWP
ncbi:MAG: sigma-70 family RNA polymerase sigma factor [Acidobacteriota bacterium]